MKQTGWRGEISIPAYVYLSRVVKRGGNVYYITTENADGGGAPLCGTGAVGRYECEKMKVERRDIPDTRYVHRRYLFC